MGGSQTFCSDLRLSNPQTLRPSTLRLSNPPTLYSTCLFCNQSLGSNEVVESFPVGRRLAFDQRKGRLWVVCRRCAKWNLTPLEERWEAIETCERLFRDSRPRTSTDNIGLARVSEGLELIRIGAPLRPEFAAWRYGNQFSSRYRRWIAGAVVGGAVSGGSIVAGVGGFFMGTMVMTAWIVAQSVPEFIREWRVIARITDVNGKQHKVRGTDVWRTSMIPGEQRQDWGLELRLGINDRRWLVTGDEARRVASRVVPLINIRGGPEKRVARAVSDIDECGGPDRYLSWVARNPPETFRKQPHWLGIEMAINEENERHALETELSHLEMAWKDAEELAGIADWLVLPPGIADRLADIRRKSKRD